MCGLQANQRRDRQGGVGGLMAVLRSLTVAARPTVRRQATNSPFAPLLSHGLSNRRKSVKMHGLAAQREGSQPTGSGACCELA